MDILNKEEITTVDDSTCTDDRKGKPSNWCYNDVRFWCRKYFWEGQLTTGSQLDSNEKFPPGIFHNVALTQNRRKLVATLLPALLCHFLWWSVMIKHSWWYVFSDKYPISIVMVFASFIAGSTGKAAGGIIFPVMTLTMNVTPALARDFTVMIQSIGLGCASFGIFLMKVHFEKSALVFCLLGSSVGIILGLEVLDGLFSPAVKKMGFVSIWFSFTIALFLLNFQKKKNRLHNIPIMNIWKMFLLICVGIIGGILTAITGSGLDICCYCALTMLFHISEKIARPTSVLLMAFSSMFSAFWRGVVLYDLSEASWQFFMVSIPVVVFCAPLGSLIGSHFHRLVLAAIIHIIDTVALIGAFAIVPQTPALGSASIGLIIIGAVVFFLISKLGERILNSYAIIEDEIKQPNSTECKGEYENESYLDDGDNDNNYCFSLGIIEESDKIEKL